MLLIAVLVLSLVAIALGWFLRSRVRATSQGRPDLSGTMVFDENVRFTVYRPGEIETKRWYSLLAFVHLSERPSDRPDEPDPVAAVTRQAAALLQDEPAVFQPLTSDSLRPIPRTGELTLVPQMDGVEFNPARQTFRWERSVHRADFQLRCLAGAVPRTARGRLTIYWGSLIVGDVPLAISIVQHAASPAPSSQAETVRPYRRIFASYSHRDVAFVEQFEETLAAIGDRYLRDVRDLRAGQVWSEELRRLIEQADVFQLFWSWNALASPFVRQEWEYALGLQRENFLRPVYWEEPLPSRGDMPPEGLRRLHFHRLGAADTIEAPRPAPVSLAPRFRWTAHLATAAALLLVVAIVPLVMLQRESARPADPAGNPAATPPARPIPPAATQAPRGTTASGNPVPGPTQFARVTIPRRFLASGQVLEAGDYTVALAAESSNTDRQLIEFRKNGVVVARELATVISSGPINGVGVAPPKPGARVETLKGGETLRVSIRDRRRTYQVILPVAR